MRAFLCLLFEGLFSGNYNTFAAAWVAALDGYLTEYGTLDPVAVYNYLGDPGSPLK